MKLLNKLPKSDPNLHEELTRNSWILLKEPRNMVSVILFSLPFMILATLLSGAIMNIFSGFSLYDFGLTPDGINITIHVSMSIANLRVIVWLVLLVVIHEFIHLLFIPNFIKSKNTYAGFTWVGAFVITEDEIPKARYITITLAPFVIISVILPLFLGALGILTTPIKFIILLNAMSSSVDLLLFLLIITQVPRKASLRSNGTNTYWKCI
jgi:hypothetical protein